MLTLYDLGPSKFEDMGLSPFVRAIRFALNYKKIPYTVINLGMTDIESTAQSLGVPPTTDSSTGSKRYTVPFIHDTTTKTPTVISDSFKIAQHLDTAYPDTPRLIPPGTEMLQSAFCTLVFHAVVPLLPIIRPITAQKYLTPEFRESVRRRFGEGGVSKALSADEEKEGWRKFVTAMTVLVEGYDDESDSEGVFVMGGGSPTFADIYMTAFTWWVREIVGDSDGWKEVAGLRRGKVERLIEATLAVCKGSSP
ncbi:hypothetical protein PM082_004280 [Marasmius tenuissimus]|nr:hypothetical protein PM082_004280 [Marasmius tenuissimus]